MAKKSIKIPTISNPNEAKLAIINAFKWMGINKKLFNLVGDAAHITIEKRIDLISKYGNCGSASILIALDHAFENNKIKNNSSIMLVAVGGGVSYGGLILNT